MAIPQGSRASSEMRCLSSVILRGISNRPMWRVQAIINPAIRPKEANNRAMGMSPFCSLSYGDNTWTRSAFLSLFVPFDFRIAMFPSLLGEVAAAGHRQLSVRGDVTGTPNSNM
jgi:hypothetical protein